MTHRRALSIVLLTLASTLALSQNMPDKPPTPFEQSLISAENSFIAAAKKGDSAFFQRTLTDDFSFVGYDGQLGGRQDMIDQYTDGGTDLLPYDFKVLSAAPEVAIVTYDVVLRIPPSEDQGPPPRYQHVSTVWVQQGGAWKMKFQQMSVSHWGDW